MYRKKYNAELGYCQPYPNRAKFTKAYTEPIIKNILNLASICRLLQHKNDRQALQNTAMENRSRGDKTTNHGIASC